MFLIHYIKSESFFDQTGNLALSKNVENGRPVRVIRGYKSKSPFAPDEGYRYDGKDPVKETHLKWPGMLIGIVELSI